MSHANSARRIREIVGYWVSVVGYYSIVGHFTRPLRYHSIIEYSIRPLMVYSILPESFQTAYCDRYQMTVARQSRRSKSTKCLPLVDFEHFDTFHPPFSSATSQVSGFPASRVRQLPPSLAIPPPTVSPSPSSLAPSPSSSQLGPPNFGPSFT